MSETAAGSRRARKASTDLAGSGAREPFWGRAARLLDGTIFFSLLTLVALMAITGGAAARMIPSGFAAFWWDAVFECAVFALGVMWIIQSLVGGSWRLDGRRLLAPVLALAGFAFIQTQPWWGATAVEGLEGEVWRAASVDPYETRLFILRLLALILAGALLLRYTSSRHRLRALVYVVIGVGVASALFGVVRQATQNGVWELPLPLSYGVYAEIVNLRPGEGGYGQFANRNHFALLMEMTLGLTLGLIAGGGVRGNRLPIYLAAAAVIWTALVLTNSRGAVISMLSQMIFLALFVVGRRPSREAAAAGRSRGTLRGWSRIGRSPATRVVLVLCLVGAVAVGVAYVGGDPLVKRLETVSGELGANATGGRDGTRRIEIWRATWQLIKDNPIAGVGFGGYWAAIPAYHDASGMWTPEQAHNDYLELLASGGLIGAALGTWFVVALIRSAREGLQTADTYRRAACLGALTGLFGVAVHSLFDYGLHIMINALLFTVLVAIAVMDGRVERKAAS